MIVGAACAALACFAGLTAMAARTSTVQIRASDLLRASTLSPVEWRLHKASRESWYQRWLRPFLTAWGYRLRLKPARLDPMFLVQAGIEPDRIDMVEIRAMRCMAALAGVAIGSAVALVSGTVIITALLAWVGYIAPLRFLAAKRRRRQAALLADLPELIGMVRAFLGAGMSLERALHLLSVAGPPDNELKREIRRALGRYGLGLTIEEALEEIGPRTGVDDLISFVGALSQGKRTGSSLELVLRDQELMIRMNRRNRATSQAAAVSTKLLAVLAGIYLPEFVLLIIIPLFWGIMQRAFG